RVMRRILPEESGIEWVDPTAKVTVIEREIPQGLVGKRYSNFDVPGRVKVVAVNRLGAAAIPTDDLVGQEGDIVHFAVATPDLNDVMAIVDAQASDGH
ncbi:MAG: hypothetical protein RLZ86_846, partial [Actinomycetota bacterium]